MPSITKTDSGRYKARVRVQGVSAAKTFTTRKAALAWATRKAREIEEDKAFGYAESKLRRLTLAEVIAGYREQWSGKDRTVSSRLDWWEGALGAVPVLQITKAHIRDALAQYMKGNAQRRTRNGRVIDTGRKRTGASANRMQAAISAVFEWGKHELDLPRNPCRELRWRKESKGRDRFLTRPEIDRLLAACRKSSWPKLYALVLMALNTGARRGELLGLTWGDVDLEARTATLHDTKNQSHRVLTLSPEVVAELRRQASGTVVHLAEHKHRDRALVFCGRHWRTVKAFDPLWHEVQARAGIEPPIRFHDLRHTAASLLAVAGRNLYEIGQVLGHRNPQTTMRYAHLVIDAKRRMTDSVLQFGNGGQNHDD